MRASVLLPIVFLTTLAACSPADGGAPDGGPDGGPGESVPLGTPCETDADCGALKCREDTTHYVGHRQCTKACNTSDDCAAPFREACAYGACLPRCGDDTDCPAGTECTYGGFCSRTDFGRCEGTVAPCAQQAECYPVSGCTRCTGACSGSDQATCESLPGCEWGGSCSGMSNCGDAESEELCSRITMCFWWPTCSGYPTCFMAADDATCRGSGCTVSEECIGEPTSECAEFFDAVRCAQVEGCTFRKP